MDYLTLQNLEVTCIIGDRDYERLTPQKLYFDICLAADLSRVCQSDQLCDTVDYVTIIDAIRDHLVARQYQMIEAAAQGVADCCLANPAIREVTVSLRKPGAIPGVIAGVTITRAQPSQL